MNDKLPTDLHCTCYRLRKATRRATAIYDAALEPAGLTVTQFSVLAMIATTGPRPMSGLAGSLGMDASTLTRTLRPLVDRGEVTLSAGEDRRVRQVALTDRGRETVADAVPYWREAQRRVAQALGGEITRLHDLLRTISRMPESQDGGAGIAARA